MNLSIDKNASLAAIVFAVFVIFGMQACSKGKGLAQNEQKEELVLDSLEQYTFTPSFLEANCRNPLTNTTFQKALDFLKKEVKETERVALTKKLLEANCFTSNQIRAIVALFLFESNKLTIAKEAYGSCADLENYFVVKRQLKLEINQVELQEFIEEF